MLLFVIETEHDACRDVFIISRIQQLEHGGIDVRTVGEDFIERRAREQAALRPRMHVADRVIIRVEQVIEASVETAVSRIEGLEDEALEKPGNVREVPLGRRDIGHRLHNRVLGLERADEALGDGAHALEFAPQGSS